MAIETHVDDLITYDAATGAPANIGRSLIRGLEGTLGGSWRAWRTQMSMTLLDPRDRTPGDDDALLPRRAEQTLRWDIDRQTEALTASARPGSSPVGASTIWPTLSPWAAIVPFDLRGGYQLSCVLAGCSCS